MNNPINVPSGDSQCKCNSYGKQTYSIHTQEKEKSIFHFTCKLNLNLKNSFVLLFTIFSIVIPIGIQPQLESNYAFAQINPQMTNDKENEYTDEGEKSSSSSASETKPELDVKNPFGSVHSNDNVNKNINNITINVPQDDSISALSSTTSSPSSQVSAQSSNEVYGDFNGDGRDDLAIGVPNEKVESSIGEVVGSAGAVHVIYGTSSGLSATSPIKNQIWDQNSGSVDDASEPTDIFGGSLAAGDFNGDGNDDLAIGVPGEDVVSINDNAGAVNVIYGSSSGLSATTVPDQFWTQNKPNVGDSSEPGDRFGDSLIAGDFNGDARDDLAIAVEGEDLVSVDGAGAVNVIYGSLSGLSATTVPDQFWTQDSSNVEDSSEPFEEFGHSLTAGDFNGDARDDLAIGVSVEDVVSINDNAGAVNVIYGSSSGLSATTVPDQFWTQESPDVDDASEQDDRFGNSLAAGDFNGDARDDLAIGVFGDDVVSASDNAGAVNVIYGSLSGLSATTVPDQFWTQESPSVDDFSEPQDNFGSSLAAGDFNGDARDDLAIGVPVEDVASAGDNAGAVNVIYGSSSGLSATAQLPDKFLSQNYPNVEDSSETNDVFGDSLTAGDFNGNGIDDLAIGVTNEGIVSPGDNAGAVNVIYGSSAGLSLTRSAVHSQFFSQASPDIGLAPDSGDRFGASLG